MVLAREKFVADPRDQFVRRLIQSPAGSIGSGSSQNPVHAAAITTSNPARRASAAAAGAGSGGGSADTAATAGNGLTIRSRW